MIQATIWSGRAHCEAEVVDALRALGKGIDYHWFVHDPEQMIRLMNLSEGMGVSWQRLTAQTFPQLIHDPHAREVKVRACANAFGAVVTALGGLREDMLLVDDDIVVPTGTLTQLQATAHELRADAVSGLTRCNNTALPVFRFTDQHRLTEGEIPAAPSMIDAIGTFCMYLTAPVVAVLNGYWPEVKTKIGEAVLAGHDLHFCHWLRTQGFKLALDPNVRCKHHVMTDRGATVLGL